MCRYVTNKTVFKAAQAGHRQRYRTDTGIDIDIDIDIGIGIGIDKSKSRSQSQKPYVKRQITFIFKPLCDL